MFIVYLSYLVKQLVFSYIGIIPINMLQTLHSPHQKLCRLPSHKLL